MPVIVRHPRLVTIDLTGMATKAAFHQTMKSQLGFPDWYGVSLDACWEGLPLAAFATCWIRLRYYSGLNWSVGRNT